MKIISKKICKKMKNKRKIRKIKKLMIKLNKNNKIKRRKVNKILKIKKTNYLCNQFSRAKNDFCKINKFLILKNNFLYFLISFKNHN